MALIARFTLNDGTALIVGDHDPSATATDAPRGSLYLRKGSTANAVYVKTGTGTTAWTRLTTPADLDPAAQPFTVTASGGTTTINFVNGRSVIVTLQATTTFIISNMVPGISYYVQLIQDGTGSRIVTWPVAPMDVKFPGGGAPTLSTAANAIDMVRLWTDGTTIFGELVGLAYA